MTDEREKHFVDSDLSSMVPLTQEELAKIQEESVPAAGKE